MQTMTALQLQMMIQVGTSYCRWEDLCKNETHKEQAKQLVGLGLIVDAQYGDEERTKMRLAPKGGVWIDRVLAFASFQASGGGE